MFTNLILQDELAEHTCPSPPIQTYIPDEDIDPYEYFIDLDYLSDGYYDDRADINVRRRGKRKLQEHARRKQRDHIGTKKRKTTGSSNSRPRVVNSFSDLPNVFWVPRRKWSGDPSSYVPTVKKVNLPVFALFKDWKKRFEGVGGFTVNTAPQGSDTYKEKHGKGKSRTSHDAGAVEETDLVEQVDHGGGTFDLGDLKDIASLLTEENMGQLQGMLEAKGIDSEALQMVLDDLQDGREREFSDEDEDEDDDHVEGDEHDDEVNAEIGGEDNEDDAPQTTASLEALQDLQKEYGTLETKTEQPKDKQVSRGGKKAEQQSVSIAKRKAGLMSFDGAVDNDEDLRDTTKPERPPKRGRIQNDEVESPAVVPATTGKANVSAKAGSKRKAENANGMDKLPSKRTKATDELPDSIRIAGPASSESRPLRSTRSRKK